MSEVSAFVLVAGGFLIPIIILASISGAKRRRIVGYLDGRKVTWLEFNNLLLGKQYATLSRIQIVDKNLQAQYCPNGGKPYDYKELEKIDLASFKSGNDSSFNFQNLVDYQNHMDIMGQMDFQQQQDMLFQQQQLDFQQQQLDFQQQQLDFQQQMQQFDMMNTPFSMGGMDLSQDMINNCNDFGGNFGGFDNFGGSGMF